MRRLRRASIALFIISFILFGTYIYKEKIVKDKTGPVFQLDNNLVEVSVKDDEKAWLKGVTAVDAADGDVSESIIVEAISPFTGTQHRIVTFAAFDSDNHVAHGRRELVYSDYDGSRFNLSKQLSFAMNSTNLLDGITVEDCIDGDITKSVKMMSDEEIDTAHVGEYPARLKVTNSAGGVSYLPVTVEIHDASVYYKLPQLKLTKNVIYVDKGSDFDEEEFLDSITINGVKYALTDGEETYGESYGFQERTEKTISYDRVEIDSDVDTDVTGYYEVVYSYEDTVETTGTGKARLYVVVTDGKDGVE